MRFKISSKLLIIISLSSNIFFSVLLYINVSASCVCPCLTSTCKTLEDITSPLQRGHSSPEDGSNHYLLVILVLSSIKTKERRETIRQTWMKGLGNKARKVLVRFSLGIEGLPWDEVENLRSENDVKGDLLLLENLQDSYYNLSRKVLESIVAVEKLYRFSYLLKCDDDSFVLVDDIVRELEQRSSKRSFYWGFFDGRAHVKRQGKWKESSWFLCDRYLPYALGGGYVLSQDLVQRVAGNSDGLALYNNEDVSVGVWLSPYSAERRHDVRFNTEFVSRGCRNVYLVSHKQSVNDMVSKQLLLDETGKQCSKEYQTRLSYAYNWTVEPSKCCQRVRGVS